MRATAHVQRRSPEPELLTDQPAYLLVVDPQRLPADIRAYVEKSGALKITVPAPRG